MVLKHSTFINAQPLLSLYSGDKMFVSHEILMLSCSRNFRLFSSMVHSVSVQE